MGYEVRLIIASVREEHQEESAFLYDGALYAHTKADFQLGKVFRGKYRSLVLDAQSREQRRYYIVGQDYPPDVGEVYVTEDCYGSPLKRLEPSRVIQAIEDDAEQTEYISELELAFLPALKGYMEIWEGATYSELIVLHYGY